MASKFTFPEMAKVVSTLVPAADAAGRNGVAHSLKNCAKAFIVAHIDQGNAATILLTPQQCSAVAGTGAKAISATEIWASQDLAAASGDQFTKQTDAANFTTDAAVKNKIVVFEIDPSALDIEGGFDCIRLVTGASNAANITSAVILLVPLRYGQATPPSSRVD
jgi:hypothetical protein